MKNDLLALSSDLRRIAIAIQKKSFQTADRFSNVAKKYDFNFSTSEEKWKKMILKINTCLDRSNSLEKAEDCLMYSVLLQNRANLLK